MRLTVLERRMLALALIFGVLTLTLALGNIATRRWGQTATAQAHATPWYGARTSWVGTATSEWPQRDANWCGPAAIEAVANYTYQLATNNQNNIPFNSGGQQRIANDLNSDLATSIWGTPAWNGIGPGFHADIANDGGTDPRGMAWGIEYESAYGWYWRFLHNGGDPKLTLHVPIYAYHNVIYHDDVTHAVGGLARNLEQYSQPVIVTVAHGLHFDVVAGVYSYNDPINSYPADVDAVDVWDPAVGSPSGGYQSAREVLWTNWTFNTDVHMWGSTYSSNSGYDPDPSVGIYMPNTTYPAHWIGYRTDFEIDHLINVLPDYAVDENLSVMQHP